MYSAVGTVSVQYGTLIGHESNPASPQAFDFRIVPPPADGITDCGSLPSDSGKLTSAPLLKSVE